MGTLLVLCRYNFLVMSRLYVLEDLSFVKNLLSQNLDLFGQDPKGIFIDIFNSWVNNQFSP